MADIYSTGYDNDNATPPVNHSPNDGGGRVRLYYDEYTQGAAAGEIGDVIHCKKLPAGARVLPYGVLSWGTGTTNETLAVGITGTAEKFLAATAAATAGISQMNAHTTTGLEYKTTAETEVIITNGTAAIAAAQVIRVYLYYVVD